MNDSTSHYFSELHDMNGNIEVLLLDCANDSYAGAPDDGSAWTEAANTSAEWSEGATTTTDGQCFARIHRGQAWKFPPARNWFARRYWWHPNMASTFIGFRVARDLECPAPDLRTNFC